MPWSLMTAQNGSRFLLNLDTCVGFGEDAKGMAVAVSLAGHTVPLGEKLDLVIDDMAALDEPDLTEPFPPGKAT